MERGAAMNRSRITELSCKEVINVCDGTRYGYVNDVEVDCSCGKILSLIIHGSSKFPAIFQKSDDIIIPWDAIKRIGEDIILVEYVTELCPPRDKRGFFCK